VRTHGFEPDVEWEPFIDGPLVGYKVTRLTDGAVTYVYMNPSTGGEGEPDVFIYDGPAKDPANDGSVVFIVPDFKS
jgi:hypothetical protein